MLRERIITACVLLAALSAVLLALPYNGFVLAVSLVFVFAAWEWANMAGLVLPWQRVAYSCILGLLLFVLAKADVASNHGWMSAILSLSLSGWLFVFVAVCRYPGKKSWHRVPILALAGIWLLVPAWLGLLYLQPLVAHSGLIWLVIAVIAAADIGAYFSGRRFGRRKLAINVSPGKTWEGFWGGAMANALLATIIALMLDLHAPQFAGFVLVMVLVAAISVLGDLFESMIKRERGIKDSSQLLPGHGGVMDRIDGWTAAVPLFSLFHLLCVRS